MPDYSLIDLPELLVYVFYPREDKSPCPRYAYDIHVAVEEGISVVCRVYQGNEQWPWILYFHGNGEIVSDFDELAPFFFKRNINLMVADYRGYGTSGGEPTFAHIVSDARVIFERALAELTSRGLKDDLWVMGRSLGSISAIELAYHNMGRIRGIIIESGFISVVRVMRHLDVPVDNISYATIDRECLEMVQAIRVPALVIHGESDTIVPYPEGLDLYENLGSSPKEFVTIPAADHNDIMFVGLKQYFEAIAGFVQGG